MLTERKLKEELKEAKKLQKEKEKLVKELKELGPQYFDDEYRENFVRQIINNLEHSDRSGEFTEYFVKFVKLISKKESLDFESLTEIIDYISLCNHLWKGEYHKYSKD